MPNPINGGGEARPSAPGLPADTEPTYTLTVPVDSDVADVPSHLTTLATGVIRELDTRLTESSANRAFQKLIVVRTSRPTNPNEYPEGTIIFVVSG